MNAAVEDFLQHVRHEKGQSVQTQKTYAALLNTCTAERRADKRPAGGVQYPLHDVGPTLDVNRLIADVAGDEPVAFAGQVGRLEPAPDVGGPQFAGCNEYLVITNPEAITDLHRGFLEAGSDIIETNSFNFTSIAMADYDMQDLAREINVAAASVAREAADEASTPDKPRYVAGVLGPTNRTASISPDVNDPGFRNVTFDALVEAYLEALDGLVEGGIDLVLIETIFDTLNAKAAVFAVDQYCYENKLSLPVMISGTITDASGRTLTGQTTEAFYNSLRHAQPISFGLNCALGPMELRPYIEELSRISETFVSAHPNAGLPNEMGEYDLDPPTMAREIKGWAEKGFLNIIGGCCGTTPEHIAAMAGAVEGLAPRPLPDIEVACRLSGLEPCTITKDSLFVNVGERTNVTGSKRFLRLIKEGDYDAALDVARDQVENGAQIIDINMDEGMLESTDCMVRFLNLVASEPEIAKVPIMIDSSKWEVIEAGLKCIQGKGVVNSISMKFARPKEDGQYYYDKEDKHVHVKLSGSCAGCASSIYTLKMGVEQTLQHYFPKDVKSISHEEAEITKLFLNSYRYVQFSIANQFYKIAKSANLDFNKIFPDLEWLEWYNKL